MVAMRENERQHTTIEGCSEVATKETAEVAESR